ncbi:hypothetical protein [Pseudomonas aeruginosa]|uniref:hypothetical protein n=1 Tax=Pseudomonas aeruginosa TaxID=287 RepID=UPI0015C5D59F|nr:hypothetical protein [Pseudomonas aeruginosa]EKT8301044.1 hypothetical protein [Pseudomonas aeruginosa]MBK3718200.1 hypothetical protein [Pseudomonas aeruginosa]WOX87154.1 hypothetical protein PP477_23900 [Pseudomonas aeruginosa]HBN9460052.1 hypothetical protein [Pseudomonas aeruginosa]HCD2732556.1 hypothetical protein [Pseudomonas aeruginosa]
MNDRTLLELAARAAGYKLSWSYDNHCCWINEMRHDLDVTWNPLTDDGDALRLAVKLNLTVSVCGEFTKVSYGWGEGIIEYANESKDAATCLAIVRAAAIMGEMLCRL